MQQFIAAHTDGLININAVVYELSLLLEREIHDSFVTSQQRRQRVDEMLPVPKKRKCFNLVIGAFLYYVMSAIFTTFLDKSRLLIYTVSKTTHLQTYNTHIS